MRQYLQPRVNVAAREIARAKGEPYLPDSYRLVAGNVCLFRLLSAPLPLEPSYDTSLLVAPGVLENVMENFNIG